MLLKALNFFKALFGVQTGFQNLFKLKNKVSFLRESLPGVMYVDSCTLNIGRHFLFVNSALLNNHDNKI